MSLFKHLILISALVLSGCGFKPLYEHPYETTQKLEGITVSPLSGTVGYTLTKELRILLPQPSGAPKYTLRLKPHSEQTGLAIEQDDSVTRYNVKTRVDFELLEGAEMTTASSGTVSTLTSYNAITSQYSTLIAEREALRRSARTLAQKIYQKLYIALQTE